MAPLYFPARRGSVRRMSERRKWEISDKALAEFHRIAVAETGVDATMDQAREVAEWMLSLADNVAGHRRSVRAMEEGLAGFPDGYELPPDSGYDCWICGGGRREFREVWFDRTGVKCGPCYMTFRKRALPLSVATDRESWYDDWDLKRRLGMTSRMIAVKIGSGELIARTVKGTGFRIFMIKENPSLPYPRPDVVRLRQ